MAGLRTGARKHQRVYESRLIRRFREEAEDVVRGLLTRAATGRRACPASAGSIRYAAIWRHPKIAQSIWAMTDSGTASTGVTHAPSFINLNLLNRRVQGVRESQRGRP